MIDGRAAAERAVINWPAILRNGRSQQRRPCPPCDRGDRDRALSVTRDGDTWLAFCHRCQFSESYRPDKNSHSRKPSKTAPKPAAARETLADYGLNLWRACGPICGVAEAYLEARGCMIPPADGDLRCHPALRHPSGYVGAALVGLLTDATDRTPRSLHRTWIRADGRKADVNPPRLLLKHHRKSGCVIRLWPDECVTYGLLIAEGVETALAAAHDFTPAWAAVDAGNLKALPVLDGIETLVIAADHDEAGIPAAAACADTWAAAGVDVHVITPMTAKADWADVGGLAA